MPAPLPSRSRHYWAVPLVVLGGLVMTAGVGWELHRDAVRVDEERFEAETSRLAALVESNMERYEERLARFADHCALFDELPRPVWNFRKHYVLDVRGNLPWVKHLVYCPKVGLTNSQHSVERQQSQPGTPGGSAAKAARPLTPSLSPSGGEGARTEGEEEAASGAPLASPPLLFSLPIQRLYSRPGFEPLVGGADLAVISNTHPFLAPALARAKGWVSPQPASVRRTDGRNENGFWFALALFATNEPGTVWQLAGETSREHHLRRGAYMKSMAKGLIGAFISADDMMDGSFNPTNGPARVHARLYSDREPAPEALMNRASKPPDHPRHRQVIPQKWYSRLWCLELVSTPLFEAESLRHRAWLVVGGGTGFTLLAGALVWVSVRGRVRQERLTAEVLGARDALTAAEKERERLGHDLHDGAIQSLYAIQLGLTRTVQNVEASLPAAAGVLHSTRERVNEVIAELRRFILASDRAGRDGDLQPPSLDSVLAVNIQQLQPTTTAELAFDADPIAAARLTTAQALQLAQIARSALANALRHGQPRQVRVQLRLAGERVRLEIADDGGGFNPDQSAGSGLGLHSMRTRVAAAGGTLVVESAPGRGTRVVAEVPCASL
jgi:signal transduction histidine kinase